MDLRTSDAVVRLFDAALLVARDSRDPSTRVGAMLVSGTAADTRELSRGVNRMCRGARDDVPERWERPAKYDWVVHAEIDAIAAAARRGVATDGCTCVVTLFPCAACAKALVQAGVRTVVPRRPDADCCRWGKEYAMSTRIFSECGVSVVLID